MHAGNDRAGFMEVMMRRRKIREEEKMDWIATGSVNGGWNMIG